MNLPWMKFEPTAWMLDTRVLSLPARAVWIDLISIIWQQKDCDGTLTKKACLLARMVGATEQEFRDALEELEEFDICEIQWSVTRDVTGDVTGEVTAKSAKYVRITCRRMVREAAERAGTRKRVKKYRAKNNPVTGDVTVQIREEERRLDKNREEEEEPARGAGASSSSSSADSVSEIPDTFSLPGVEELVELKGCVAAVVGLNPKWGEGRKVQVIENALKGCSASVRAKAVHDFLSENVVQGSTKDVFPRNWFRQFMERAERERLNIGETSGPRGNFVGAYQ